MWKYFDGCKPPATKKSKTEEEKLEASREYDKKVRKRVFQSSWEREFKWVLHDGHQIYCKVCRSCYSDLALSKLPDRGIFKKYSKGPFVIGCSNLRKSTLLDHQTSQGHIDAEFHIENRKKPGASVAEKSIEKLNDVAFTRLSHLFRNAHAIAKYNQSFSSFRWMADLDEKKGVVIGDTYKNDKACREFIRAISTVISDGSTDVSVKENEAVYIRFCHKGVPQTIFVSMQAIEKADATGIMKAIKTALKKLDTGDKIDIYKKVIAFAADGASINTGKLNGVISKMRDEWNPSICMVQCLAHRLELMFKESFKADLLYEKVMSLLSSLFSFYHKSPLQRSGLQISYKV